MMEQMEAMTSMPAEVNDENVNSVEEINMENINPVEEMNMDNVNQVETSMDVVNEVEENIDNNMPEIVNVEKSASNFDSLFDNLYSDVAGANNLISNLLEKKKTIGQNEAYLEEEMKKLEKEKADFQILKQSHEESNELEKQKIADFEKAQKIRIENEQRAFGEEVAATRKQLELSAVSNRNDRSKLDSQIEEFNKRKASEEAALKLAQEKLVVDQTEFEKYRELENSKIEAERNKFKLDKEAFEKEINNKTEQLNLAIQEFENAKKQFEEYKNVEKQKLELESNNLSQSCARFKELVSQFNSGFKDIKEAE